MAWFCNRGGQAKSGPGSSMYLLKNRYCRACVMAGAPRGCCFKLLLHADSCADSDSGVACQPPTVTGRDDPSSAIGGDRPCWRSAKPALIGGGMARRAAAAGESKCSPLPLLTPLADCGRPSARRDGVRLACAGASCGRRGGDGDHGCHVRPPQAARLLVRRASSVAVRPRALRAGSTPS